ncbi:Mannan endo-1,6-alpha-mannosidase [Metarhizium album ARSEF 1941]|uniref:Mannan endo-1,6-alpha-mannosidase n=1 Tax=Metarhizium album (strain ARSEF 1941) TaxID=1081103 RepID=A0A0B2WGX4_METAS|nr:Mannan endo-1,6-alpha-mannosidase [Metarhizium album ARSEF 1941]KHN95236.1 Mannan endo-1,6-alpha-mannosidase [Metarhizium album ARSEF 1941]
MLSSLVSPSWFAVTGALLIGLTHAQYYKVDSEAAIKESARTLAYDLMLLYKGNQSGEIPGILPGPPADGKGPYYWWEGGAMMGTYIDYWKLTGDSSYNKVVMQGLLHQVGENQNYMPKNHTMSLGNDDQGFWGLSAMLAAENKFPDPPADKPQWLALAQAVWNTQADPSRYDETCNGGLRWQIPFSNQGYGYKNTISNGIFFNMGARLARYTRNDTYAKRAEKAWDWMLGVGYIDTKSWSAYDGAHVAQNCTDINKATFSYNAAVLTQGAAFMYNYTDGAQKWKTALDGLLDSVLKTFFPNSIAYEVACEGNKGSGTCTPDMLSFKGYVHRWLAMTTQIAPYTKDKILPVLRKSAEAAIKQCTGGPTQRQCGFYWNLGRFVDPSVDKTTGAGEQMNVLAAVSSLLIEGAEQPVTKDTGGTSVGNPNAGGRDNGERPEKSVTGADRAGAGFLTFLLLGGAVGTFVWMSAFD